MKVIEIIYCDDIRREIAGKHSLIGVYDSQIYVSPNPNAPKPANLGFLVSIYARLLRENDDPDRVGMIGMEMLYNDVEIAKGTVNYKFEQNLIFNIIVDKVTIQVGNGGTFKIKLFKMNKGDKGDELSVPEWSNLKIALAATPPT